MLLLWLAAATAAGPPVGRTGGVRVLERGGAVLDASPLIQRMAFQRSNASVDDPCGLTGCGATKMAFQLSTAGGLALRDWGLGGEYATQAHLVAEKLASLGGVEDLDYLRQELVKESLTDGVAHVSGTQWHLGYQGGWEVNAEWILSVERYIAHSGDAAYTDRVPERLVCVRSSRGQSPCWRLRAAPACPPGHRSAPRPLMCSRTTTARTVWRVWLGCTSSTSSRPRASCRRRASWTTPASASGSGSRSPSPSPRCGCR